MRNLRDTGFTQMELTIMQLLARLEGQLDIELKPLEARDVEIKSLYIVGPKVPLEIRTFSQCEMMFLRHDPLPGNSSSLIDINFFDDVQPPMVYFNDEPLGRMVRFNNNGDGSVTVYFEQQTREVSVVTQRGTPC